MVKKEEKMKKIASLLIIILIGVAIDGDAKQKLRKFYLTQDIFTGSQVLTACAKGYHMASLWEIFDTSNLSYNTNLGFISDDSGSGPPAGIQGWIRTGGSSNSDVTQPGVDNCDAWTKDTDTDLGTVVELEQGWAHEFPGDNPTTIISPWGTENTLCFEPLQVWCVQD
jgi:hypothetical protein